MRLSVKYINFIWPTCCWENFSWQHSHVACKIVKPGWGVSMSCCETVNYQILYLSLRHHSACASITVQKSEHFHVPVYQRLREDQFHAPIDQLCREVHGNFHVPFDQLCREVYGNFHVPFEQLCLGIHGNIHVPFEHLCLRVHENFHVSFEQLRLRVHGIFRVPFEQLGFLEEHGNVHLPFANISSINSFLTVCFVFGNYKYTLGRLSTKNPKLFAFLTNNSYLTAEFTLFIF